MTPHAPPFNAQERDIDLMLLEELHCNPKFLDWISGHAGIAGAVLFLAHHSVYRGNGETDVLALLDTPDGRLALMIEDKIGAQLQPRQAERYHERGAALCSEGSAKKYRTLLCAPLGYLGGIRSADWHATLSFEEIAEWFNKQNDTRAIWRRDTLLRAAQRQRRSMGSMVGTAGNDLVITDNILAKFKQEYRHYIMKTYPEFVLSPQFGRDREYYFKDRNFPAHMRLKHSFSTSTMVLVFEQHWKEKAKTVLSPVVPEPIWMTTFDRTVHLNIGVEPIDLSEPVANQTDLIDTAMQAAQRLLPYAAMVQEQGGP